ncbi:MAG: ribonucleoside triphosphate reductase [Candidatus Paceibacterota bacterium]
MVKKLEKIQKRDGRIVDFDQVKITDAVEKAILATNAGDGAMAAKVSDKVTDILSRRFRKGEAPNIEQVQDVIEEVLMLEDLVETAKAYIIYREQRRQLREIEKATDESVGHVEQYLNKLDWEVKENANMAYSLQGLNHYVATYVMKKYWLEKIYPKEVREANENGAFHVHNLDTLGPYCMGWDLYDFLLKGFGGVNGKVESKPPKHFRSALGQIVNFLYTMQGECAGAVAFSNFDTLLAPYIRHDNLNYQQVKQAMQEFMFNLAVPTRVGFQTPFTNITLDIKPSAAFASEPALVGGVAQEKTYSEYQEEMRILDKAIYECMLEGDKNGRPFTFPIPTINITKDFDWDNPDLDIVWEATAKYGINYFANYINSEMDPKDVRSMCCRLRLDLTELRNRGGGGLFGAGALTGSVGVVTINLPRIGHTSKTKKEFFAQLHKIMDLAKDSLEIKRKVLENFIEKGLYPYSRYYLAGVRKARGKYFANHFSTIGLTGMNETLLNFLGEDIGSQKGRKFTLEVLDYMRDVLVKYQEETGNIYNLEATPAESTSYRLALKDLKMHPDIIHAGTKEVPYYTNSTLLPVNYTDDVFETLKLQDEIQCKYTGGTVLHIFVGERIHEIGPVKNLVKKIFSKFRLPYITITPTFSICPVHGYISGEHKTCPKCVVQQPCEVYSRIVGYLRPVNQWNEGKQQEYCDRKTYKVEIPQAAPAQEGSHVQAILVKEP